MIRIAIGEHGARARSHDRERGGDERVRRNHHFIAAPDFVSAQQELDGVGAAGDADAMTNGLKLRELALERGHFGAENVGAAFEQLRQPALDLFADGAMLQREIH